MNLDCRQDDNYRRMQFQRPNRISLDLDDKNDVENIGKTMDVLCHKSNPARELITQLRALVADQLRVGSAI